KVCWTQDHKGIGMRLAEHWKQNPTHVGRTDEGFLTRLWPLQEIDLSNKIQFVKCNVSDPQCPIDQSRDPGAPGAVVRFITRFLALQGLAATRSTTGRENGVSDDEVHNIARAFMKNACTAQATTEPATYRAFFNHHPSRR